MATEGNLIINGYSLPYPEKFTMTKVPYITAEYTTMAGNTVADINGWKYADTTITWAALETNDLNALIDATAGNSSFNITFVDTGDGATRTEEAILRSFSKSKVRYLHSGKIMWEDVSVSLSFPKRH